MDSSVSEMSDNVGKALSVVMGVIGGPFVSLIFGSFWNVIFANQVAAESQEAMNRLFEAIEKMIQEALAELIADQARAYNATAATLAEEYKTAQQDFLNNPGSDPGLVVTRFEYLKGKLLDMINLYSQKSYIKHTLLSYAFTLSTYVVLLHDGVVNGKHFGYREAEIDEFQREMDSVLQVAYKDILGHALLSYEQDEEDVAISLSNLVGGLMHFHSSWGGFPHRPSRRLFPFTDYDIDVVDSKARYLLNRQHLFHAYVYPRVQIFLEAKTDAVMVLHDAGADITKVALAKFKSDEPMNVRFRLYYFENASSDYQRPPFMADFKVVVRYGDTIVHQFVAGQPTQEICSFFWPSLSTGSFWNQILAGLAFFPAIMFGAIKGQHLTMRYCIYSDVFRMEAGVHYSVHIEPLVSPAFLHFLGIEVEPV